MSAVPVVQPPALDLATLLRGRRTIHLFQPECPPEQLILSALDLARWAPNHRLTEPWRFYLIGPQTADAIARRNAALVAEKRGEAAGHAKYERWRSVPGWFAVMCQRSDDPVRAEEDYAACCCALQNAMLYLWHHGIGTKWISGAVTRDPQFFELLAVDPAKERFVGLVWYGYPAEVPTTQRQPLTTVLTLRP